MPARGRRQLWTEQLKGGAPARPPAKARAAAAPAALSRRYEGVVLGIDPSLRGTGLALVRFAGAERGELCFSQTVRLGRQIEAFACLGAIARAVEACLEAHPVDAVAVESTIHVQNSRTALILGSARGAAIAEAAKRGLPVHEYPPSRIKQAVTGQGEATKEQVGRMLAALLVGADALAPDESDAAGAAFCHASVWRG
jgi:crossover junction endodeoxyribonuclease RuvC